MKKLLKSYITFTRSERMGLLALCTILLLFILVRASMHLWVHPSIDTEKEKQLVTAWEAFKRGQTTAQKNNVVSTPSSVKNDYQDAYDENDAPLPDIIDINTADSATLVRLKGIGPVTASRIIESRNTEGPFTDVEQILEICHMPHATFAILKKHLVVSK